MWTRRRREPAADRWALAELQRLEKSPLRSSGDFHELYFRLTSIIRGYVERRFGIAAPKWTTAEFMAATAQTTTSSIPSQQTALGQFLAAADLVKFACVEPSGEEVTAAFAKARDFIHETTTSRQRASREGGRLMFHTSSSWFLLLLLLVPLIVWRMLATRKRSAVMFSSTEMIRHIRPILEAAAVVDSASAARGGHRAVDRRAGAAAGRPQANGRR